jgi:hypothetical protein
MEVLQTSALPLGDGARRTTRSDWKVKKKNREYRRQLMKLQQQRCSGAQ